jgi:hypothetical protein
MAWADRTPTERSAIDYCVPHGIPLSVFCGRVVYPGEPQWLDDDRAAVWEWSSLCSGCRQELSDSMQKANSFAYQAEALRCHGCYAIEAETARLNRDKTGPLAGINRYIVKKVG